MIVIHLRGPWLQRVSALRWWLEVKSLTIALVVACVLGVAFAAFVAVALFGCDGSSPEPPTPQPAPPSYTIRSIRPADLAQLSPAKGRASSTSARPGSRISQVLHSTLAGKRTTPCTRNASCVAKTNRLPVAKTRRSSPPASRVLAAHPTHPPQGSPSSQLLHPPVAGKRTTRWSPAASCVARHFPIATTRLQAPRPSAPTGTAL